MIPTPRFIARLRAALQTRRGRRRAKTYLTAAAAVAVVALAATVAITAPRPPSAAEELQAYVEANAQSFTVPSGVAAAQISRDVYSATPGIATLAASGTNYDWAKLVLLSGGWPMSDNNVTVLLRWMRQENGTADWWHRNNPLNNGYGSGGGGGTGTYASLIVAAQKAAEGLHNHAGYGQIVAALASSAHTDVTEHAIWASPWATGHYANGGHWSSAAVDQVKAPESAW